MHPTHPPRGIVPLKLRTQDAREGSLPLARIARLASRPGKVVACALVLLAAVSTASPNCLDFGGFAVFQCARLAYFAPAPFEIAFDPNSNQPTNVSAVFWQLGFGNNSLNTGLGTTGTGNSGADTFNGNDSGLLQMDLADAREATGGAVGVA